MDFHLDHIVKTETLNIRLDLYLKSMGVRLSRTRVAEIIKKQQVRVNDKYEKPSYKVKTGDHIVVDYAIMTGDDIEAQDIPVDIIYEDDDIIVINKDADMVVHPAKGNRDGTLVNALLYHSNLIGGNSQRPGVVHRLDKDTTGVMVFAKNQDAHTRLSMQVENRMMKRTYLAVVWGSPNRKAGKIDAPIGRSPLNRKSMAITQVNSRNAVTRYRVIRDLRIASILKVNLETGRTHQIRVHAAHIGHPVIGDTEYGKNAQYAVKDLPIDIKNHFGNIEKLISRQALHSVSLGLMHPVSGEWMTFYAPLENDILLLLDYIYKLDKAENL